MKNVVDIADELARLSPESRRRFWASLTANCADLARSNYESSIAGDQQAVKLNIEINEAIRVFARRAMDEPDRVDAQVLLEEFVERAKKLGDEGGARWAIESASRSATTTSMPER